MCILSSTVDVDSVAINDAGRKILDYASDTSSDDDITTVANTWKGFDMDNSDYESIDSDDDTLKSVHIIILYKITIIETNAFSGMLVFTQQKKQLQ